MARKINNKGEIRLIILLCTAEDNPSYRPGRKKLARGINHHVGPKIKTSLRWPEGSLRAKS